MRCLALGSLLLCLVLVGIAPGCLRVGRSGRPDLVPPTVDPAIQAERDFLRRHPGEKPLNWRIAAKAQDFYRTQPMGKFVLNQNDCSDFVEAAVDDALGAQARFRRHSSRHLLMRIPGLWDVFYWDHKTPLQPGDVVSVEHSPHYPPYEGAIWHVGAIGPDGQVYDWSKLKVWSTSRYGCHSVEWFTRHASGPQSVEIWRLNAMYRYRAWELPLDRR